MTAPEQHLAALAQLYGPDAETLRRDLPEIADCLHGQLHELHARPSAARVDVLLVAVEGIRRHLARYRERLIEGEVKA